MGMGTKQIRVRLRAHQRAFGILPKDPASALPLFAFPSDASGILPEHLLKYRLRAPVSAVSRRKYSIPRLSALNGAVFKKNYRYEPISKF
jgi:hypothetical protein